MHPSLELGMFIRRAPGSRASGLTNINHEGLQRTTNEYAEERRIYKDLMSKNNNLDICLQL